MARPAVPASEQTSWEYSSAESYRDIRIREGAPAEWVTNGRFSETICPPSRWAAIYWELPAGAFESSGHANGGAESPDPIQLDGTTWGTPDTWTEVSDTNGQPLALKVPQAWTETDPVWDDELQDFIYVLKSGYMTVGELFLYRLQEGIIPFPDPEPDPDPDPDPAELADAIVAFAGLPSSPELLALAQEHAQNVTLQVRGFTRGRGFSEAGEPADDIRAVIVSAAARSMANPTGMERVRLGASDYTPGTYAGWTLAELAILHNYRKRWA